MSFYSFNSNLVSIYLHLQLTSTCSIQKCQLINLIHILTWIVNLIFAKSQRQKKGKKWRSENTFDRGWIWDSRFDQMAIRKLFVGIYVIFDPQLKPYANTNSGLRHCGWSYGKRAHDVLTPADSCIGSLPTPRNQLYVVVVAVARFYRVRTFMYGLVRV